MNFIFFSKAYLLFIFIKFYYADKIPRMTDSQEDNKHGSKMSVEYQS